MRYLWLNHSPVTSLQCSPHIPIPICERLGSRLGSINKNEQGLQKMLKTWLGQEIGQRKDEGEHGVESPVMFETLEPRVLMNASPVGQVTPTPIASSTQPVVVQDVNGTQLTVSLSGHGSWQITQGPNGLQLTVTGTDANSQLTHRQHARLTSWIRRRLGRPALFCSALPAQ